MREAASYTSVAENGHVERGAFSACFAFGIELTKYGQVPGVLGFVVQTLNVSRRTAIPFGQHRRKRGVNTWPNKPRKALLFVDVEIS